MRTKRKAAKTVANSLKHRAKVQNFARIRNLLMLFSKSSA